MIHEVLHPNGRIITELEFVMDHFIDKNTNPEIKNLEGTTSEITDKILAITEL